MNDFCRFYSFSRLKQSHAKNNTNGFKIIPRQEFSDTKLADITIILGFQHF